MPPTVSATAHRSRPMDWSIRVELRAESLRNGNPLPSLLQILLQVNQLRSRAGAIYTVLGELYSNALEHGVLGLDSSSSATPRASNVTTSSASNACSRWWTGMFTSS